MARRLYEKLNSNFWLSFVVVAIGTIIAYWFSLFHLLRSEILIYFWYSGDNNSILSLTAGSVRSSVGASDTWLFRPFDFLIMAMGKVWLGFNSLGWHIVTLALFLLMAWCLFRLLWKIRSGILAILVTLFFSTMYATVNAMLYTQLMPYLGFVALSLTAIYYLYRGVEEGRNSDIAIAAVCMFVSSFMYEMGVVLMLLSVFYLWLNRKRVNLNWKLSYGVVIGAFIGFMLFYAPFKLLPPTSYQLDELSRTFSMNSLSHGAYYIYTTISYWMCFVAFPASFELVPVGNLGLQSAGFENSWSWWWALPNMFAVVILAVCLFPHKDTEEKRASRGLPLLLILLAVIYLALVALYRGNDVHTGLSYILNTNITLNMFLAWALPLVYYYLRPNAQQFKFVALALLFLVSLSASKTFMLNYQLWQIEQPYRAYLSQVDSFIRLHENEADFSFEAVADNGIQEKLSIEFPKVAPSGEITMIHSSVPEIKYRQHWDSENPKYKLNYNSLEGELIVRANR